MRRVRRVGAGERGQSIVVFSGTTDRGLPPGVVERLGAGTVDYMGGKPGRRPAVFCQSDLGPNREVARHGNS